MKNGSFRRKCMVWLAAAGMGGTCFQLSSCDDTVRGQILGGLNSATDVLLTSLTGALFMSLENSGSGSDLTLDNFGSSSGT